MESSMEMTDKKEVTYENVQGKKETVDYTVLNVEAPESSTDSIHSEYEDISITQARENTKTKAKLHYTVLNVEALESSTDSINSEYEDIGTTQARKKTKSKAKLQFATIWRISISLIILAIAALVTSLISMTVATLISNQDIRLVTTATAQPNPAENAVSGRLEIYLKGQWGTVCDDNFGDRDASVACKQLGGVYNGTGKVVSNDATSDGTGPIWLDEVGCTGPEGSLLQCDNRGIGVHNCDHGEDVGVKCYKN